MKKLLTLLFCGLGPILFAQVHPTCDGDRYIQDVFNDVVATDGIIFGEGTTIGGNVQELKMDIYEPMGDVASDRPVLIFAFGGSFISGSRSDVQGICEDYARKGFVTAAVDYRLYDGPLFPIPGAVIMQEVVVKALSDIKASIRFMRESADLGNPYNVDPDLIFIGGISAGAIGAMHAAVLDEGDPFSPEIQALIDDMGGLEGNSSTNTNISSAVQGVISFSGALNNAQWIDAEDPPFISVHDDGDMVVPYALGSATIFGVPIIEMEGSARLQERADSVGVDNKLITVNSDGHVSYLFNENDQREMVDATSKYLHDIVCPGLVDTKNIAIEEMVVYPNPSSGLIYIDTDHEIDFVILRNMLGSRMGVWKNNNLIDASHIPAGNYMLEVEFINSDSQVVQLIQIVR